MDRLIWASALRAAAKVLDESDEADATSEKRKAPPKSQTTLKAVRRARPLVAPEGKADELASRRATVLLRSLGISEVDDGDDE